MCVHVEKWGFDFFAYTHMHKTIKPKFEKSPQKRTGLVLSWQLGEGRIQKYRNTSCRGKIRPGVIVKNRKYGFLHVQYLQ